MVRNVYLHGALGREFGRHFRLAVDTPAEAVRALGTLRPPLRRRMARGGWRVVVGRPHVRNSIGSDAVHMRLGSQDLHLVPARGVRGGDGMNVGKIIVGAVLIGAAFALTAGTAAAGAGIFASLGSSTGILGITGTQMAVLGGAMMLGGIAGLMTPAPQAADTTEFARPEDRPSFIFSGVVNNSTEGMPVPLVYGYHLVGSIVGSGGILIEDGVS